MPNHVRTKITFPELTDSEFDQIVDKYCKREDNDVNLDFERIIPMPKTVYRGPLGFNEMEKYPLNWYSWSCEHWGTKWNAYDGLVDYDEKTVTFSTAWSFAEPVIRELARQTGCRMEVEALNEDIGCGAIWATYCTTYDGELVHCDGYYSYGTPAFWEVALELWGLTPDDMEDDEV